MLQIEGEYKAQPHLDAAILLLMLQFSSLMLLYIAECWELYNIKPCYRSVLYNTVQHWTLLNSTVQYSATKKNPRSSGSFIH